MTYKKRLRISASKLGMHADCPKKLEYKYVLKVEEPDQPYFKLGKDIEALYCDALTTGKMIIGHSQVEMCAKALLDLQPLNDLLSIGSPIFQNEYKIIKCDHCDTWNKIEGKNNREPGPCKKCANEIGTDWGLIGYTDIEVNGLVQPIDVKSTSSSWGEQSVQMYKWQAKMYAFMKGIISGQECKKVYFASVNTKTFKAELHEVNIENFDDLFDLIEVTKFAFEIEAFPASPSWKCAKMCPFAAICPKR